MNQIISPKIIAFTFGILTISFLAAFYVVAWQEPTQAPPEGNVATPLNVGNVGQSKSGGLILNTGGALYGLIVEKGQTILKYLSTPFVFNFAARPAPPETGHFYFDQNDKNLYYYNGTMWMRIQAVPSGTGKPCTAPSQCENGLCVDSYCCDTACNTTCYSCNAPGREGLCTMLTNYTEDGGCSNACKGCYNGQCVNVSAEQKDEVGLNVCTATHYRCDGAGNCIAPVTYGWLRCNSTESGLTGHQICVNHGWAGCRRGNRIACYNCDIDTHPAYCNTACNYCDAQDLRFWSCYECYNWVYD